MVKLIIMCGLQCSGKSTQAEILAKQYDAEIISSDQLRIQYPDYNNENIFKLLYRRANNLLFIDRNVIIDATNITIKSRRQIFNNINISCKKICYIMNVPYNECRERLLKRNQNCERAYNTETGENIPNPFYVPMEILEKYYKSFEIPFYEEGWDQIIFHNHPDYEKSIKNEEIIKELANGFNQNNKHHTQDLGTHMNNVGDMISENSEDRLLRKAAYFHDTGKLFTQSYKEGDPDAHYYNHANVGAYGLMCTCGIYDPILEFKINEPLQFELNIKKTLDWLFYINYHMVIFNLKTDKAINKWKNIFGEEKFNNLVLLNNADKYREEI